MRPFALAEQSEGINLLRSKGGASPRALFDLKNGWVTAKRTINARPGAGDPIAAAPAGTVGGLSLEGKIIVFAATPVASADPNVEVRVLRHPTGGAAALSAVHYAAPLLGRLYVVAEFADGVVKHYWLQQQANWSASTVYTFGKVVTAPGDDNGFVYEITAPLAGTGWAADTETALNDEVHPSTPNGFKYRATSVTGSPCRTSDAEPNWPTTEGATVTEYRSG